MKDGLGEIALWESFLASASPSLFGVYVHAKTPTPRPVLSGSWVDPLPLETAWGDWSLIKATKRLFASAVDDGCDAMVLVSGDMVPLQSFDWIHTFCQETRFSVQPRQGLNRRQRLANAERFALIAPYFDLPLSRLCKQNMFFVIQRNAFCRIASMVPQESFPLKQLADEYYWINHLTRLGVAWRPSNVVFCNPDPTRTQALPMHLTVELLCDARATSHAFIRKIKSIDENSRQRLHAIYKAT